MRTRCLAPLLVLGLLSLAPAPALAQRLGAVSSAVHGGGSRGSSGSSGSSGSGYRPSGGYGGYGYAYGGAQVGVPWVPLFYPYYLGYAGVGLRQTAMQPDRAFTGPDVIGIVDASAGYVFDGVVRGQLSGRVRIAGILDIELRYAPYFEQTHDVIHAIGLGRAAFAYALVADDAVQLRIGAAGQLYHDAAGIEVGLSGLLELDAYPIAPLVIHLEASAGSIGQASMLDGRATLGLQIERGEIYVGYQVFAVDPLGSAGTALHGPVAGVRVWIS